MPSVESSTRQRSDYWLRRTRKWCDRAETGDMAARSDAKVLITGESGVGKDVLAQPHSRQLRAAPRASMWRSTARASTESLLESELFGHVKGSFTGAYRDKVGQTPARQRRHAVPGRSGRNESADAGAAAALSRERRDSGGGRSVDSTRVNVRVIAATNRNLSELVAAADSFVKICSIVCASSTCMCRLCASVARTSGRSSAHFLARRVAPSRSRADAWQALERYRWPGNVRELQNIIEQMVWLILDGQHRRAAAPAQAIRPRDRPILPARERRRQLADELYKRW